MCRIQAIIVACFCVLSVVNAQSSWSMYFDYMCISGCQSAVIIKKDTGSILATLDSGSQVTADEATAIANTVRTNMFDFLREPLTIGDKTYTCISANTDRALFKSGKSFLIVTATNHAILVAAGTDWQNLIKNVDRTADQLKETNY